MLCIILELINPKAKAITRNLKDKFKDTEITDFKGDQSEILTHAQMLYDILLLENYFYLEFHLDLFRSLQTVQDKSFQNTINRI